MLIVASWQPGVKIISVNEFSIHAKLGWRILKEDHALWVRVLKGTYFRVPLNLNSFTPQSYGSLIWRGTVVILLYCKKAYMWLCPME